MPADPAPVARIDATRPVMLVAQDSRDAAQLTMRIQDLEQQVRDLTGQVQGLQFQLTQLQTLLDRSNQDNDFRFKALESGKGGVPGKNNAATQSDGVTPSGALPQNPGTTKPIRPAATLATPPTVAPLTAPTTTDVAGADQSGDNLGSSMDPLVGKGKAGEQPDALPLGVSPGLPNDDGTPRPLNIASAGGTGKAPNADAAAQYKAGYDAIVRGDYAFAEDQFRQFIGLYPKDPQAPDATNWLGEALLQRQDYVDAADVLVTGYKTYPESPRAPDMLLKLGIALNGAQQPAASCKTFGLLSQKYPNTTTAFRTRLKQEMVRAKCTS